MTGYEEFKKDIFRKTGIDLNLYKEKQMKRRLESLVKRNDFNDFKDYFKALDKSPEIFDEFINYLTINVSEFYRNSDQWVVLEKEVVPRLLEKNKNLKIWSAACSTGEEPYSLVMMLSRFMPLNRINIIATDIDLGAIAKAKAGLYMEKSLKNLPKEFITKYFTNDGRLFKISDDIKKQVTFKKHNLLKDSYVDGCDLIVCRNVLIYFTEEAKNEIYMKFSKSLKEDGILFVGSTEQIIMPQKYELKPLRTFFYGKDK